jgi:CHASE3 domain sensor protein
MNPARKTKNILFWLGLSLPMLALLAMTWLVHQSSGRFNSSFNWVMQTYKVLDTYEQTQMHIVDAESHQRGYLLTGRPEYLEPYRIAMQAIRDDLAVLKKLTAGDRAQQANLVLLEKLVEEELVFDPAQAFPAGQPGSGLSVVALTERGRQKIENLRRVLFRAHQDQQEALSRRQQEAEASVVSSQVTSMVLISAVAMALILVVVIRMRMEKLQEFVTVCAWTGQVKFQGQWLRLDEYLKRRFDISVSHSMSQEAADKMMKEIEDLNRTTPPTPPAG